MLDLDNFILRDYASWKLENHEFLELLSKNSNEIYDRIEPVYLVLERIYEIACDESDLDNDLETIFLFGFEYIHSQMTLIKIYYDSLFKGNYSEFAEYSKTLLYLMYIYEIRSDLESHDIDSDIESLNTLETYIENTIMERKDDTLYIEKMMNEALKEVFSKVDYDYVSIIDIYVEIAENLGIFLFEKEFVIGNEI
jgi:hypothetical protein